MKNKLRSVNTRFWDDTFIEDLTPSEKLLFLYLLTNSSTNILGMYEISLKRISYETGLNTDIILKGLKRFGKAGKAYFENNYIILPNFLKNQNLNANMKKGAVALFNELPSWLRESVLANGTLKVDNNNDTVSNGYATILNGIVKYEREIEDEEGKGNRIEGVDYDALLNYYNTTCKKLPQAKELNDERISHINARLEHYKKADIKAVIEKASKSSFLNGNNDKKFRASFDWLMLPTNFLKVLEGNYDDVGDKRAGHGSFQNDFKL